MLTSNTFPIENYGGGYYEAYNPVPIGAVASLTANSPGPAITSYEWSGGSNFAGYVTGPANQGAPLNASITTPATSNSSYSFIVGPMGYQYYNISVTVQYQGGGSGAAYLTFISDAPRGVIPKYGQAAVR